MIKLFFLPLLCCTALLSDSLLDGFDIESTIIVHSESEQMQGNHADEPLPKERNSYSSLYAQLRMDYDITEDLFLSVGAKANRVLVEDTYTTPQYIRGKMNSDTLNRAILSEASVNYDNGVLALIAGRQSVDYDWLLGSIDGILAMAGSDDQMSLRLFWFQDYNILQYNYYARVEDINENKGMYGAIAKLNKTPVDLSVFSYYVEDLRHIFGGHFNLIDDRFGVNISYSEARALSLASYDYDESFLNMSVEFLYRQHYLETGVSKTGKNGLLAMIQMGSFMFGQFYLSNQVDRENALNGFVKYIYADRQWRFECIGGITHYDNHFVHVETGLRSYELDLYLKYKINAALSADMGVMFMNVDANDPLQVDQNFVMFNVVYSYENF